MSTVTEKLALVGFPKLILELLQAYFRIEVEGVEYLPKRGKGLIIPNHSGCTGLDAVMLSHVLNKNISRIPRILTLWTLFNWVPPLGGVAQKLGLRQASAKTGLEILHKN